MDNYSIASAGGNVILDSRLFSYKERAMNTAGFLSRGHIPGADGAILQGYRLEILGFPLARYFRRHTYVANPLCTVFGVNLADRGRICQIKPGKAC